MKFLLVFAFASALAGLGQFGASAAREINPTDLSCGITSTQAHTLVCGLDAVAKSSAEVRRAFERDLKRAKALDKDFGAYAKTHGMPGSSMADRLTAAQADWLKYVDAQCSFEGQSSFGGSGEDILNAECQNRLNLKRIAELNAARKLLER